MNVLFIPSWHPWQQQNYAGRFFLDQAKALAENNVAKIWVLNWGQNEFQIQYRKPLQSIHKILRFMKAKPRIETSFINYSEIKLPHLTWYSQIHNGNIDRLAAKFSCSQKFDLIHAHVAFPGAYLAWKLSQKLRIPYIVTEHSGPFPFPEFLSRGSFSPQILSPLQAASKVIAVSSFLQKQILDCVGIAADIIPNMVDTDFFRPSQSPVKNNVFRLFALSSLTEAKGALDLCVALDKVHKSSLDFELFWGGTGKLHREVSKRLTAMGLEKKVKLLGELSPAQALTQYQNCDAFILPSRIESFSMVLIEALACGKPILATDCGGPRDIVSENCGLLIKPKDQDAMAKAIILMATSHSTYSTETIREYCLSRYSVPHICASIGDLYKECLMGKN